MTSSSKQSRTWFAVDLTIQPGAREAVEYGVMEAGALGTEFSDHNRDELVVTAYFDQLPDRESIRKELYAALQLYSFGSESVRNMQFREVEDRDWLAEWKKSWQPVTVGGRFIIAPPWSDVSDEERVVIRIEPGMAFGTGTHETTRLCLRAIERYFEGGSFLDVGTGTGILAIAAAKLAPEARITALDTDAGAIEIAMSNAALNAVANITFKVGSIDPNFPSADCVCANLTTETIVQLLPQLLGAACRRLILSGILSEQLPIIDEALRLQGITSQTEIWTDGEWACVIV